MQDNVKEELAELQQQVNFEKEEKAAATAQVDALRKDVARVSAELEAFKASGASGEGDLHDLKATLEDKQTQLNDQIAKVEDLESQVGRLSKEKDLINKKMERVQQQKDAETRQLKQQLESSAGATQDQINERDRKINELVEELGDREVRSLSRLFWARWPDSQQCSNRRPVQECTQVASPFGCFMCGSRAGAQVMLNETKQDLDNLKVDIAELEDLRVMRQDIQRQEKANAELISNQAKRLEELEGLYKEEQVRPPSLLLYGMHSGARTERVHHELAVQVTRKKLFNTIQDMKGKIRVYCRVRPMLDFETERGQAVALNVPDELTASHFWKDEKKPREYQFDSVRCLCCICWLAVAHTTRAFPLSCCWVVLL